jgi:pimeloyl-ACP methyl ester carboxylesterase
MIQFALLFLFTPVFVIQNSASAQNIFDNSKRQLVDAGKAELHGYFFKGRSRRPNTGRPILLTHGLNSNLHEFESLIPVLTEQGFDCFAFNFRGHGNDDERSEVKDYTEGDYDFNHLVHEDFPSLIAHIRKSYREPVTVVGHSMGGMVPRAALIRGSIKSSAIRSMVLLGSPAHFETRAFPGDGFGLDKLLEIYTRAGSGKDSFDLFSMSSLIDRVGSKIPGYGLLKFWFDPFTRGVGISGNFGKDEDWYHRAISQRTPKDIYRSFLSFRNDGYEYRDEAVPVPILHIVGLEDKLAPANDVRDSAPIQSADAGFWLIALEGISHLDLVAKKAVESYRDRMLEFLTSPARTIRKKHGMAVKIDTRSGQCEEWLK